LPNLSDEEVERGWQKLPELAVHYLGEIPVAKIEFDATRRKEIDTAAIDLLLP